MKQVKMIELTGFRIIEDIGNDGEVRLYRMQRLEDGLNVIAKTSVQAYPDRVLVAAFQYEYECLRKLHGKGVLEPHSLEFVGTRPILLLKDSGGTTLEQLLSKTRASLKLPELLQVAISASESLGQLHHAQMTLNEITPFSLIVNADYTDVKFIDIRLCRTAWNQSPLLQSSGRPVFVLPYLSPEQTGRTGMTTDYRTDFYSLGVTLYEWFAGSLPFQSHNAMDLVHQHLTVNPDPIHKKSPSIPRMISEIINKCMSKMPDERYASAYGISADLKECDVQLRIFGKVREFPLATHDISEQWIMQAGLVSEQHILPGITGENELRKMPDPTSLVLGSAAFLGKEFELYMLQMVTGLTMEQVVEFIDHATQLRLLQPKDNERLSYIFQNESIHHAAYERIAELERTNLHLKIGMLLAERIKLGEDVQVSDALHHLNQVVQLLHLPEQKMDLAELNLQAGLEAKQMSESTAALEYLRTATELLDDSIWESNYTLMFQSHKERAYAEFIGGNCTTAIRIIDLLMKKVVANQDKVSVNLILMELEIYRENHHEVIAIGKKTMELLNVPCDFSPTATGGSIQWVKLHWKLRKHSVESIAALSLMTDETHIIAMKVLNHMADSTFIVDRNAWSSTILMMLDMTMDYGMTPEAAIGFAGYTLILNFRFYRYEAAYKWGLLACTISKSHPNLYPRAYNSVSLCYDSWRRFEPDWLLAFTDDAGKLRLKDGDTGGIFNHSILLNCGLLFNFSCPLQDIYVRLLANGDFLLKGNNSLHIKQAIILSKLLTTLTGDQAEDDPFREIDIEDASFLLGTSGVVHDYLQELIFVYQYITRYLFAHYKDAHEAIMLSVVLVENSEEALFDRSNHYFYQVLVLAEIYDDSHDREKAEYIKQIRICLKKTQTAAHRCPENYLHKYMLMKAEMAILKRNDRQVEDYYERAINAARAYGHIHDTGIIAERFAKYALHKEKFMLAKVYMNEACEAFQKWGALAKVADMEEKYPHLLHKIRESELERVDYLTVVKSAQVLSGEMEMDRLLHTLMHIMLQNAGAEYGALIFENDNGWMIEAYGTVEEIKIESIPLDESDELVPTDIIQYTARTMKELVLHDAANQDIFIRNAYVRNRTLRSVLCLPIMHQSKLICLLYMDNNLLTGVFTEKRLDVLKLLSSQCAISVANAKLFSRIQHLKNSLEEQVEERTQSLEKSMQETSAALAEMSVYAERNRIAQEIHDIVGHTLTSTVLQIEAGKRLLHKDMDGAVNRLKEAQDLVRHSLSEIRSSVHMLKEDKYYDLVQALSQLMLDTERNTGVVIHREMDPLPHISVVIKKLIYHSLLEGLTNGMRHGHSKEFNFRLNDDGSSLQFRLKDNGQGTSEIKKGFGLRVMEDRVEQLGGGLHIESEPDQGYVLRMYIPY
ncbi:histidine kinase [Paenibacillus sp. FA6]|uniref:histidine kinase n=1 Tax=Paenibacillus sp. FA6 TaxID=3413029 RepID=UPI003F65EFCA